MSIKIEGMQEVIEAFDNINNFNDWAVKPMNKSLFLLHGDIAQYPPQRQDVTYRRTGTLGRNWTTDTRKSSNGIVGELGNNTSYAPFVQGEEDQAWFHAAGDWVTDKTVMDKNETEIIGYWGEEIDNVLKR